MDNYPIPNIEDFTQSLAGAKLFLVMNCKRTYHQIPMPPEDIEKTTITTPIGLFHYHFTPFGLMTVTQMWQCFINDLFR